MTACLVAKVFTGQITTWSAPELKDVNPTLAIATKDAPIVAFAQGLVEGAPGVDASACGLGDTGMPCMASAHHEQSCTHTHDSCGVICLLPPHTYALCRPR